MGKKAPKVQAPAAPDPVATANAQAAANIDTARVNFANSAVNQYTPYGSLEWTQWAPDRWSAVQRLDPAEQHLLNQNRNLDMTMNDMGQRALWRADATLNTPFNGAGVQQAGQQLNFQDPRAVAAQQYGASRGQVLDFMDPRQAAAMQYGPQSQWGTVPQNRDTQYVANAMLGRMRPQLDQQREARRNQLMNQGVREGSEAWNRAMDDWARQNNDLQMAATLAAGQEQGRLFGQDLQAANFQNAQRSQVLNEIAGVEAQRQGIQDRKTANYWDVLNEINAMEQRAQGYQDRLTAERQRQLQEAATFRQVPLNEMIALAGGQQINTPNFVNTPQFNSAPGNIMDATYQTYAGQQNAYNQSIQQAMANRAGMYGLLGTGLMTAGLAFSDERLKTDIEHVGFLGSGLPVYSFRYLWSPLLMIGVMAQEAVKIFPDAVSVVNGYLAVDYSRIR